MDYLDHYNSYSSFDDEARDEVDDHVATLDDALRNIEFREELVAA